jgi:diacylglycerol kinase (ATP)
MIHWPKVFRSFAFALKGLKMVVQQENNAGVHLLATVLLIAAAWFFKVSATESLVLCLCTGMVWLSEIFNSAIERLTDLVSPERQALAGATKDMAAAAVLVASLTALLCGLFIFVPHLLTCLN